MFNHNLFLQILLAVPNLLKETKIRNHPSAKQNRLLHFYCIILYGVENIMSINLHIRVILQSPHFG